jgi:hypothetical protein
MSLPRENLLDGSRLPNTYEVNMKGLWKYCEETALSRNASGE